MKALFLLGLMAVGSLSGWALSHFVESILLESDPRAEVPPCFEVGAPFHHRFRPQCVGEMKTPRGPVRFSVNEDGLRELPRSQVMKNKRRILLIGDSFVEGWWVAQEQALSSLLGERFPGIYFINGGLRSTGPVMQLERLVETLRIYQPQGVIWFLNDTDIADDRFACAVAENPNAGGGKLKFGVTEFDLNPWQNRAALLLGSTAASNRLRRRFYQKKWLALANHEIAAHCDPCRGVQGIQQLLSAAKIPLLPIYLHTKIEKALGHYRGLGNSQPLFQGCFAASGGRVHAAGLIDNAHQEAERYLWEGDFHFNPEGLAMLAEQITPTTTAWLKEGGAQKNVRRTK